MARTILLLHSSTLAHILSALRARAKLAKRGEHRGDRCFAYGKARFIGLTSKVAPGLSPNPASVSVWQERVCARVDRMLGAPLDSTARRPQSPST